MDLPTSHHQCIITAYQTDLGLDGLVACFKQTGTITMEEVVSESLTTQTAQIAFKNQNDAIAAEKPKDLWLLETVLTPDNDTEASRLQSKPRKRAHSPEAEPKENTRIFCQISWSKDPQVTKEQLEEEFFNYFAYFGVLEFVHTIKDNHNRLSHGFVKCLDKRSAQRALQKSNLRYRAIPARSQYSKSIYNMKTLHQECGIEIDRRNLKLHEKTCSRQRALKRKTLCTHRTLKITLLRTIT